MNESKLALDLWFKGQQKSAKTILKVAVKNEFSLSGAYKTWMDHMLVARAQPELALFLLELGVDCSFLISQKYGTMLLDDLPTAIAWCAQNPAGMLQLLEHGICYQGLSQFEPQFEDLLACAPEIFKEQYLAILEKEINGSFDYYGRLENLVCALENNPGTKLFEQFRLNALSWSKGNELGILNECESKSIDPKTIETVKRRLVQSRWMKLN